ncbi:MAG: PD40 domain-containing protein [Prevotella sp.]|nr:PD40 domain-containing protein [Prevotella sp.]
MSSLCRYPFWLLLIAALCIVACTSKPHDVTKTDAFPDIYPDYVGVTVPVGIAPLNFAMTDDSYSTVDVEVKDSKGNTIHVNGAYADFDIDEWHQLLEQNKGGQLSVTVCAEKNGVWTQYRDFHITVSPYALEEWGVTYRRIAPGYESYSDMGIYQRELSNYSESVILENTLVGGMCLNCHTTNRTNPNQYVFHVRGENGGTVINRSPLPVEILQAKNDSLGGAMVYPYWHPNKRYCAFSTNKTSQMFHTANNKRIEVYDSSSDVFVYDTETHEVLRDTLIMKKYWAENCPAFSPDGKWLYFITAKRQVYPTDYDKEMYSLCRVSFDETTGKLGQQVDTLINTRKTGKSATWPRPSYDGRFLMYTQANYGYFSIWHPESDLWLLDLQTGESHPMNEVNTQRAESFHNWNVNSHWFLFTSRRDDGLYTRIYFSSIDDNGHATKPFMLPQRNPKLYYLESLYSFNTPDFATSKIIVDAYSMRQKINDNARLETTVKTTR